MRHALTPIIGLVMLQACVQDKPPPVLVSIPVKPIVLPIECSAPDDPWHELPDRDVKLSEAARHERINKDRYAKLLGKRKVCRVSVIAVSK